MMFHDWIALHLGLVLPNWFYHWQGTLLIVVLGLYIIAEIYLLMKYKDYL